MVRRLREILDAVGHERGRQLPHLWAHHGGTAADSFRNTLDLARRAASVTSVRRVEVKGVGHPMLRRASVWHDLTTQFVLSRLDQSDRADRADQSTGQMGTNHSYGIPTGIFQQI